MTRHLPVWALVLVTIGVTGCQTHNFARRNTVKHTSTLTDLVYGQILDNVAMFESNPHSLPHFAVIGNGTTQAVDVGGGDVALTWNPFRLVSERLGTNVRRQLTQQWGTSPVMSAGRLRRIRCAFQIATSNGYPLFLDRPRESEENVTEYVLPEDAANQCVQCIKQLVKFGILPQPSSAIGDFETVKVDSQLRFYADNDHYDDLKEVIGKYQIALHEALGCQFPQCWYHVKKERKLTNCECYGGHHCDTYVAVNRNDVDALSRFSMTVLTLASTDSLQPSLTVERDLAEEDAYYLKQTLSGDIRTFDPAKATDRTSAPGFGQPVIPEGRMPFAIPSGPAVVPQVVQ